MSRYHNTLYVTTQGAYLAKDHENIDVRVEKQTKVSVPFHHISGVVCFGGVTASPEAMAACLERGIAISFLDTYGHFLARVEGPVSGNVLLRRSQYRLADDQSASIKFAKSFVAGKIANARSLFVRSAREQQDPDRSKSLRSVADRLSNRIADLARDDLSLDAVRGLEGEAAANYFNEFGSLIRSSDPAFQFKNRSRRPPLDPINALLSFIYAIVRHDCESALSAVGLDPYVGFLHADRPGRVSLALDLMEEFRPALADRLIVSMINRGQFTPKDFVREATGGFAIKEDARKSLLVAYQERKQTEIKHPFTEETTTIAVVPHIQARLLARVVRGDLESYPPFIVR